MIMTPSRMVRFRATAEIATRATDVGSGEKTPVRAATVALKEREIAVAREETAGLPRGELRNGCR